MLPRFLNNKRTLLIIAIAVVAIVVVAALAYVAINDANSKADAAQRAAFLSKVSDALPKKECVLDSNRAYFNAAIMEDDLLLCACIPFADPLRNECDTEVSDSLFFSNSITYLSLDGCKEIKKQPLRELCIKLVNGGIEASASAPFDAATKQFVSGDYSGTIDTIEENPSFEEDDIDAKLLLAVAYANQSLFTQDLNKYTDKAIVIIDEVIAKHPDCAECYRVKGFIYEVRLDFGMSLSSYDTALELDSNNIRVYISRGHAFNKMGSLYGALADFEKAKELDVNKSHLEIYAQLCRLYSSNEDFLLKAIDACQEGISLYEKRALIADISDNLMGLNMTMGNLYLEFGMADEAIVSMKKALTYAPNSPDALVGLSKALIISGDYASASAAAEKAIGIDSKRSMAYAALAVVRYGQGRYDEAEQAGLKAISLIDEDVSLLRPEKDFNRKVIFYNLSNIAAAKGDAAKAAEYEAKGDAL